MEIGAVLAMSGGQQLEEELVSIDMAYLQEDNVFFWISLAYGVLVSMLLVLLVVQMCKVPANDYFVLKGSIYLAIGTLTRVGSSFYLYISFNLYKNNLFNITHREAYGVVLT